MICHFKLEEIKGDNINDMKVILSSKDTIKELAEAWEELRPYFKNLNSRERKELVQYKELMKLKLTRG